MIHRLGYFPLPSLPSKICADSMSPFKHCGSLYYWTCKASCPRSHGQRGLCGRKRKVQQLL